MRSLCILGAGGHAFAVTTIIEGSGIQVSSVFDDNPEAVARGLGDHRVQLGIPMTYDAAYGDGVSLGIGDIATRARIASVRYDWPWATLIHRLAVLNMNGTTVGKGLQMFPHTTVGGGATIGDFVILNTGCLVAHGSKIGDFAHLSGHAVLGGDAEIGEGALIGLNATVLPGVRIGAWSVVGAGAVVTKDTPPGSVVAGNPARVLRRKFAVAAE
jgi:sugar O-acyltransferase (sialic acid O-acetyltransferase NeuD family)